MVQKNLTVVAVPLFELSDHMIKFPVLQNRANLQKAGIWDFIHRTWEKPDVDRVRQFVQSSEYGGTDEIEVNGSHVQFDPTSVAKLLQLPMGGAELTELEPLTTKDKADIFGEKGVTKKKTGWDLTMALPSMSSWLLFVNQRLFLAPKATMATDQALKMGLTTWQGVQYNWGQIVYDHMKREMATKKTRNPLSLVGATYMSLMGKPFHRVNLTVTPLAVKTPPTPPTVPTNRQKPVPATKTESPKTVPESSSARKRKQQDSLQQSPRKDQGEQMGRDTPIDILPTAPEQTAEDLQDIHQLYHTLVKDFKLLQVKEQTNGQELRQAITREATLQIKLKQLEIEKGELIKAKKEKESKLLDLEKTAQETKDKWTKEKAVLEERIKEWEHRSEQYQSKAEAYDSKNLDYIELMRLSTVTNDKLSSARSNCMVLRKENEAFKKQIEEMKMTHTRELSKLKYQLPEALDAELHQSKDNSSQISQLEADVRILSESNAEVQEQTCTLQRQVDSLRVALWNHQVNSPPSYSLFRAYELQRDVLLDIIDRTKGDILTKEEFEEIWDMASNQENQQNLVCEMLTRGDLCLDDWSSLFYPIADIGARVLLYYVGLERQMEQQRQIDLAEQPKRPIIMKNYRSLIAEVLKKQPTEQSAWKKEMQSLREAFGQTRD